MPFELEQGEQTAVRGERVAVLAALLLLWEAQALEGGGCLGVAEHRVLAGGELADAVVSYALPISSLRKDWFDRMIGASRAMLNAIVGVWHNY